MEKEGEKRGIPHSPSSWSKRGEIDRETKGESSLEKAWNSSTQKEGKRLEKEGKDREKIGKRGEFPSSKEGKSAPSRVGKM